MTSGSPAGVGLSGRGPAVMADRTRAGASPASSRAGRRAEPIEEMSGADCDFLTGSSATVRRFGVDLTGLGREGMWFEMLSDAASCRKLRSQRTSGQRLAPGGRPPGRTLGATEQAGPDVLPGHSAPAGQCRRCIRPDPVRRVAPDTRPDGANRDGVTPLQSQSAPESQPRPAMPEVLDVPPVPAAPDTIGSVAFVSLGCPKNLVDSERMLGLLSADGLAVTDDAAEADAVVINTCGFLEASKTESMAEINAAIDLKKSGRVKRVIVAGCLVQRHKTKLLADAPGIDRLVGVFDREHIVDAVRGTANPRQGHGHYLGKYHGGGRGQGAGGRKGGGSVPLTLASSALPPATSPLPPSFEDDRARLRLTPRHFAYLRMSEGCNQGCAFCTIPGIRGPMRSKPIEQILTEAKELAADGAVEINLIGQDTTSYGTDVGYAPGLAGLLRTLDRAITDVGWLRLMYAYPSCFTDEMIDAIAACDRVVKYIDMPLQHVSDAVLARMKRKVTRREVEALLAKLRDRVPGIALRTTMIAGSPGETEAEHRELVDFVRDFGFDMLGVFPYSPEPGTPMGRRTDQVPDDVRQARTDELMTAQQAVAFARSAATVGQTRRVLIDRCEGDVDEGGKLYAGRTAHQAPDIDGVTYVHDPAGSLHAGQFVDATVTDWQSYDLVAAVKKTRPLAVLKSRAG